MRLLEKKDTTSSMESSISIKSYCHCQLIFIATDRRSKEERKERAEYGKLAPESSRKKSASILPGLLNNFNTN
jgi:DNA topoisomerase IB